MEEMKPSAKKQDTTRLVDGFITEKFLHPGDLREWYRSVSMRTSLMPEMTWGHPLVNPEIKTMP